MAKLVSLVILAGLQIGSIDLDASAYPSLLQKSRQGITNPRGGGCACHCDTDTASFRAWQQKDGPADLFAAKIISKTIDRPLTTMSSRTELFILLGRSAKGIWTLETQVPDNEGSIYTDLVCITIDGKHKVFPVVKSFDFPSGKGHQELRRKLNALVLRRLRQLAKSGRWDADLLVPVQLPLLSKPPALVLREKGKPDNEKYGYSWTLSIRGKNGRLVRITGERGPAGSVVYNFRAAKCFGGVTDEANGVTWWIMVKTAAIDGCGASWYSIRLTHNAPVKQ